MRKIVKSDVSVINRPGSEKPARRRPVRNVALGVVAILAISAGTIFAATVVRVDAPTQEDVALTSLEAVSAAPGEGASSAEDETGLAAVSPAVSPNGDRAVAGIKNVPSDLSSRIDIAALDAAASATTKSEDRIGSALESKAEDLSATIHSPDIVEVAESEEDVLKLESQLAANGAELFNVPVDLTVANMEDAGKTAIADSGTIITGSIARPNALVEVAETETETLELEAKMAKSGVRDFEVVPEDLVAASPLENAAPATVQTAPPPPPVAAPDIADGFQRSKATKYVNMRAGPNNNAEVISIVPANAEILAEVGCRHWCSAVYNGKKGHIYRSFIQYPDASADG